MRQVKIFSCGNKDMLEKQVNEFISKNNDVINDIQFRASKGIISTEYSVMILCDK